MEGKIKVIQISSASHSFSMKDYEEDIFKSWYARVAFQLKTFFPDLDVECWTPERKYIKERIKERRGIRFRVFPTTLSLRHSIEISFPMLRALWNEQGRAKQQGRKLILHFHEYHSWLVYLVLLFIGKDVKIIAQHHGARNPFANLGKHKKLALFFPAVALMQFFENLVLKKIDIFYALSDEEISYLKKKLGDKKKVKFQTMGIGKEYFKKGDKEKARKKLNLKKQKKYALYIGRIKKNKGITELLDAIKKLKNKDVELLLIGDGPNLEEYKSHVEKNKIENIRFLGLIYGDKKIDYLDACDCFILPSYTEGCPVVLMEAIARNLPVIATNVGGIPKMIKDGREGIIIKPKSIREIEKAVREILTWKKNIRKFAEKYEWKRIIKNIMEDYKNIKNHSIQ